MVRAIVGANWETKEKARYTDMLVKKSLTLSSVSRAEVMQVIPLSMIMVNLRFIFFHLVYSISTLPASLENGVALNIPYLIKEIQSIVDRGVPKPHILVSDRAQILMPYHVLF